MELLGDVGHVEARFGPFGDGVSVSARYPFGSCGILFGPFGDGVSVDVRYVHYLR